MKIDRITAVQLNDNELRDIIRTHVMNHEDAVFSDDSMQLHIDMLPGYSETAPVYKATVVFGEGPEVLADSLPLELIPSLDAEAEYSDLEIAVGRLNEVQMLLTQFQGRSTNQGSPDWHAIETIHNRVCEAMNALERELAAAQ